MATIRRHWPVAVILVLFLALGIAYSILTPLFESPDEVWHYEYVRWLVEGNGLPTPEQVGSAPWHQEGSQPPLYYLAAALLTSPIPTGNADAVIRYNPHAAVGVADSRGNKNVMVHGRAEAWPWQGVVLAAHVARWLSLFFGTITVLSAYGIGLALFPRNRAVAVVAASLVAFNPQFLFISSSVTNGSLVTAACSAGVWMSVHLLDKYARVSHAGQSGSASRAPTVPELLLLGALAGVAALAQLSGVALVGIAGLTLIAIAWRQRAPFSRLVAWVVVMGLAALLVAGWWYIRNLALYGDPLGLQAMFDVLPKRKVRPTLGELAARAEGVWRSMWAVFGWFNVVVDNWVYAVYGILSLVAIGGLVFAWPVRSIERRRRNPAAGRPAADPFAVQFLLLLAWIGVILLAVFAWTQMRYPQGRLLFPALAAVSVLFAFGLTNWLPGRLHRLLGVALPVGLGALAVAAPFAWIVPAYAAPALLPSTATLPGATSVEFGDQLRLAGYELGQAQVQQGDNIDVTLYWQAANLPTTDYSIFVHLVDENGILQAQHDSYPAAGSLPTTEWPLDATIPDRHTVRIPATVMMSPRLAVEVGVYDGEGKRLVADGRDSWRIGEVEVVPRDSADGIPNPSEINWDDQVALIGFDFDRQILRRGETLKLSLWWEALRDLDTDYVVFTHLVYPPDAVWAGVDQAPQGAAAPTSTWRGDQVVADIHELTLRPEAPPGVYFVEIGVYGAETGKRLKVDGSDKGIVLGYVKVE